MEKYTTEELMDLMVECNSWDGSFEDIYCYDADMMEDLLHGLEITQIMNMVHFGDYNPSYDYFRFDGYGNIVSVHYYDYEEEVKDRADEIVEHARELGII